MCRRWWKERVVFERKIRASNAIFAISTAQCVMFMYKLHEEDEKITYQLCTASMDRYLLVHMLLWRREGRRRQAQVGPDPAFRYSTIFRSMAKMAGTMHVGLESPTHRRLDLDRVR